MVSLTNDMLVLLVFHQQDFWQLKLIMMKRYNTASTSDSSGGKPKTAEIQS